MKRGDRIKKLPLIFLLFWLLIFIGIIYFYDIFHSTTISFFLITKEIHLYPEYPEIWNFIKIWFSFSYIFSSLIISYLFSSFIFQKLSSRKKISLTPPQNNLSLFVGNDFISGEPVYIPEKGLFQNILITGTIGTGKTSSAMYPFTNQLIKYFANNNLKKISMLILDVKGNYYQQVLSFAKECGREKDIITIELNGKYKYNPLYKPHLKPSVIANQLKEILLLFSPNNTESFWLDKVETTLNYAISLCSLYNNAYVTFDELHKITTNENYYSEKIDVLKQRFTKNKLNTIQIKTLLSCINYFSGEFFSLDSRTLGILKSEITRITNCFISDPDILSTFCPSKNDLNFLGFKDVINSGKIVVLNMNINQYRNLSKIIAAYLKLDFQTEVLSSLSNNSTSRITAFISDEYSEYVTQTDSNFFSQSREAKCINIVATQSYTSLLNTLNNQNTTKVITQNLVNKLWFRSDDIFTIEDAQKQIGKIEKEKTSKTISENSKRTHYSFFFKSFNSVDTNLSESINKTTQLDYVFDTNFFTQNLETFTALSFLSDGNKIIPPKKIKLVPWFYNK